MELPRRQFFRQMFTGLGAAAALPVLGESAWSGNWRSLQFETAPGSAMRLDSNENPYGPCARGCEILKANASTAHRYPKHDYIDLAEAIAATHGVSRERLVLGCGSAENLRMAAATYLGPGKTLILASPTFELLAQYAENLGAPVVNLPLTRNHAHDLSAMLERAGTGQGLVYICNPNNPTATLTPRAELESFVRKLPSGYTVLMDEAYHHFVTAGPEAYTSFLDRAVESDQLIVTRTFSKIYGLAGMRIGYAVSTLNTAKRLAAQKVDWAMSLLAARAALAAWNDPEHVRNASARNANDRQEFYNQAKARGIPVIESQTNFAMLDSGRPVQDVIAHFKKNNVLIGRPFPPYTNYARISFGTPPEMQEFWRVWDLMPSRKLPA